MFPSKDTDLSAKSSERTPTVSRREREILEVLYQRGASTVAEMRDAMDADLSLNAVRTFLTIMASKGHVNREKRGREFVYRPAENRDEAGLSALRRVLDVFYGGSLGTAMASHLTSDEAAPDEEDLARLEALIKDAKNSKKK